MPEQKPSVMNIMYEKDLKIICIAVTAQSGCFHPVELLRFLLFRI